MVFDPVGSTSWHNRHLPYFRKLGELLRESGITRPTILIVGPGAVTVPASWLLNDAARPASSVRKLIGDAARYADQALRRIPRMPLVSLEPREVESALAMEHDLVVVDRSLRVLAAVARENFPAQCGLCDIAKKPIPLTADAVIAFNVVCRLDDPATGMRNVCAAVRPGGLLLVDDRTAASHLPREQFTEVALKTHRRTA